MSFLENIGYILGGFVLITVIFLTILTLLEKKLHIKFLNVQTSINQVYIGKLSKLNINKPQTSLKELDKLAKNFFREAFHLKSSTEYSELEKQFKKRNNKKAEEFSNAMTKLLYAGQKPSKSQVQIQIKLLAEIITSNKIISKEQKEKLDKKSLEKEKKGGILRKTHILSVSKKKLKNKKNKSKQN